MDLYNSKKIKNFAYVFQVNEDDVINAIEIIYESLKGKLTEGEVFSIINAAMIEEKNNNNKNLLLNLNPKTTSECFKKVLRLIQ